MCSLCAWLDSWGASTLHSSFVQCDDAHSPLCWASSGGQRWASERGPWGSIGQPQRSRLSKRCTEGHKAAGRLAGSEGRRLHLKWLHVVKLNDSLQIYFLLGMLKVWLNALNLTERPTFVGGNIGKNEYKAEMKNSGQLERFPNFNTWSVPSDFGYSDVVWTGRFPHMAVVIVVAIPSLTLLTFTAGHPCRTTPHSVTQTCDINRTKLEFGLKTRILNHRFFAQWIYFIIYNLNGFRMIIERCVKRQISSEDQ